jgi:hypothetical protein
MLYYQIPSTITKNAQFIFIVLDIDAREYAFAMKTGSK